MENIPAYQVSFQIFFSNFTGPIKCCISFGNTSKSFIYFCAACEFLSKQNFCWPLTFIAPHNPRPTLPEDIETGKATLKYANCHQDWMAFAPNSFAMFVHLDGKNKLVIKHSLFPSIENLSKFDKFQILHMQTLAFLSMKQEKNNAESQHIVLPKKRYEFKPCANIGKPGN